MSSALAATAARRRSGVRARGLSASWIGLPAAAVALVAAVFAAMVACGGAGTGGAAAGAGTTAESQPPPAPPRWQDDLSLLLPADATVVGRADAARLRASPYYVTTRDALVRREPGSDVITAALEAADELWFGARVPDDGGDLHFVLVGRGADLAARVDAAAAQQGLTIRERASGVEVMREAQGARAAVVALAADTRVLTRGEDPAAVVARAEARAPRGPLGAQPSLQALAARVKLRSASAAVVAAVPEAERARLRQRRGPQSLLADARAVAARLEAGDGVTLEVTADMESAEAAARARDSLAAELDRLAGNPLLALMGLRDVIARARITASGDRLDGAISLPDAEVRPLLQRFGPLLSQLAAAPTSREAAPALADAAPRRAARTGPLGGGAR